MAKFKFVEWLIEWLESQSSFTFEWDHGNCTKSMIRHGVSCEEAESVFYQPETIRVLGEQISPKSAEPRLAIFGLTLSGKPVFLCFTLRASGIRIISVRELNRKERMIYEGLCQN